MQKCKRYRAIAARCMYLCTDRPKMQFAVQEACREMAKHVLGTARTGCDVFESETSCYLVFRFASPNKWCWTCLVMQIGRRARQRGRARMVELSKWDHTASNRGSRLRGWSRSQPRSQNYMEQFEQTLWEDYGEKIDVRAHIVAGSAKSVIEREG